MISRALSVRRVRLSVSLLAAGLSLLLGSCGASRTAFHFRPAPTVLATPPPAAAVAPAAPVTTGTTASPSANPLPRPPRRAATATRAPHRLILAGLVERPAADGAAQRHAARFLTPAAKSAAEIRSVAPRHRTEVGLGTTVLGVLGLIVLPLALLGLLIWGGPVWAVLAGLAALAVLVAYLDPFK